MTIHYRNRTERQKITSSVRTNSRQTKVRTILKRPKRVKLSFERKMFQTAAVFVDVESGDDDETIREKGLKLLKALDDSVWEDMQPDDGHPTLLDTEDVK